ncbi:hypothetical protein IFM12276_14080 [Nocardia sputorum]|uniref:N-acetyltransferase domain-containing protein n=1 Tax=Nocardia sputorum TaxID=2984338 RepID=A0ABN6TZJ8_9NOCA|nr:hypothetical protein [Nocardia sputorum]BDT98379.1 hypothetical protein IFM12276_14080 [Nocardia sputorum]
MTTSRSLELARYDAAGTLELADELKILYLDSHREQQDNPWYSPARFWERLEEMYAPIPGFELVAARIDGRMIGYAFGTPYRRSQAVWKKAVRVYPRIATGSKSVAVYIFGSSLCTPTTKARATHGSFTTPCSRSAPNVWLTCWCEWATLRARPRGVGWQVIGQDQPFADAPIMDEMARPLH